LALVRVRAWPPVFPWSAADQKVATLLAVAANTGELDDDILFTASTSARPNLRARLPLTGGRNCCVASSHYALSVQWLRSLHFGLAKYRLRTLTRGLIAKQPEFRSLVGDSTSTYFLNDRVPLLQDCRPEHCAAPENGLWARFNCPACEAVIAELRARHSQRIALTPVRCSVVIDRTCAYEQH
jgi:hypothetical protein